LATSSCAGLGGFEDSFWFSVIDSPQKFGS
jgi:hypothetical protein